MTTRIRVRPEAVAGLVATRLWYNERRRGLGAAFMVALRDTVSRIASNPLAFPFVRGGTRRAVLRSFPHGVHFRIREDQIVILAVFHGRHR